METASKQPYKIITFSVSPDTDKFIYYTGRDGWATRPRIGDPVIVIAVDGSGVRRMGVVSQEMKDVKVKVRKAMGFEERIEKRYEIEIVFTNEPEKEEDHVELD